MAPHTRKEFPSKSKRCHVWLSLHLEPTGGKGAQSRLLRKMDNVTLFRL